MIDPSIPIVSILVPVYNVRNYLRECLDSIIGQTFKDWECILVDDGSTDGSGQICDEYEMRDSRFRVIHIENGGVSAARNTAIEAATGEFIIFCDSDDWMEPVMIETLHRLIIEYNADVAQVSFWFEFVGEAKVRRLVDKTVVLDRPSALYELARDIKLPSYMWNKLFRRRLVKPEFPVGMTFEDLHTSVKWFRRAGRVVLDPTPLYHYRMRRGSIVHSNISEFRRDYIEAVKYRADEMLTLGVDRFSEAEHDRCVAKAMISGAKTIARLERNKKKRERALVDISGKMRGIRKPGPYSVGIKGWFRFRLLLNNPKFFSWFMRATRTHFFIEKYHKRKLYD